MVTRMKLNKVKIQQFSGLPLSSMHLMRTWCQKSCKNTICKDSDDGGCYLVFTLSSCFLLHLHFVSASISTSRTSLAISVPTDEFSNNANYSVGQSGWGDLVCLSNKKFTVWLNVVFEIILSLLSILSLSFSFSLPLCVSFLLSTCAMALSTSQTFPQFINGLVSDLNQMQFGNYLPFLNQICELCR